MSFMPFPFLSLFLIEWHHVKHYDEKKKINFRLVFMTLISGNAYRYPHSLINACFLYFVTFLAFELCSTDKMTMTRANN